MIDFYSGICMKQFVDKAKGSVMLKKLFNNYVSKG